MAAEKKTKEKKKKDIILDTLENKDTAPEKAVKKENGKVKVKIPEIPEEILKDKKENIEKSMDEIKKIDDIFTEIQDKKENIDKIISEDFENSGEKVKKEIEKMEALKTKLKSKANNKYIKTWNGIDYGF